MDRAEQITYRIALTLWIGGHSFFSFILGPSLFAAFPREQAGEMVAALFPAYYATGLACGSLVLALSFACRRRTWIGGRSAPLFAAVALAFTLLGAFWLQPKIHAIRKEMYAGGTLVPEGHPLRKQFGAWHGVSLGVNFVVLAAGLALVVRRGDSV